VYRLRLHLLVLQPLSDQHAPVLLSQHSKHWPRPTTTAAATTSTAVAATAEDWPLLLMLMSALAVAADAAG
jgi:hypothetical protein